MSLFCRQLEFDSPEYDASLRLREDVLRKPLGMKLRLQDQRLEHRNGIEGRTPASGAVTIAQPLNQPAAKVLEIDRRFQNLQRIADFAQPLKMLRKPE